MDVPKIYWRAADEESESANKHAPLSSSARDETREQFSSVESPLYEEFLKFQRFQKLMKQQSLEDKTESGRSNASSIDSPRNQEKYLVAEWENRKAVLEGIFSVLMDGKGRTPGQILNELPHLDKPNVDYSLICSVLSKEADRYVWWEGTKFTSGTFRLKPSNSFQEPVSSWHEAKEAVQVVLSDGYTYPASEIQWKLNEMGLNVPMWMLKSILVNDDFGISSHL